MNKKIPDFFKKWGSDSFGGEPLKKNSEVRMG
jgi:hypothetical protein